MLPYISVALSGNPVISVNGQLDVQQHKRREDRDWQHSSRLCTFAPLR